jgi:RsiW-degrading membrane proteinase PrsW (M82 family)
VAKFAAAYAAAMRRSIADEPVDMPIYMITAALGFASVENAFFLFRPVFEAQVLGTFLTGDLRFLGATLIHVLASSVIGGALAISYYEERPRKILYGAAGVILAVLLHAIFNSLIILQGAGNILLVFVAVWVGVVFLLLAFERVKEVERPQWWQKIFMKRKA